jgi:hypothetical protein
MALLVARSASGRFSHMRVSGRQGRSCTRQASGHSRGLQFAIPAPAGREGRFPCQQLAIQDGFASGREDDAGDAQPTLDAKGTSASDGAVGQSDDLDALAAHPAPCILPARPPWLHASEAMMTDLPPTAGRPLRFLRSPALHARAEEDKINFKDLVGLYVGDIQSSSMKQLTLALELTLHANDVKIDDSDYVFAFRAGTLQIDIENGSILPGSLYRHELQKGGFKAVSKTDGTQHTSKKSGADISAELGASLTGFVSKITAGLRAGGDREMEKSASESEITEERILLVYGAGQNRLQVGCPMRGDPRHPRGWLLGSVIDVAAKSEPTPLCVVEATDPSRPVVVHVSFRFNPQRPCLFRKDHHNDSKGELLARKLDKINARMLKRRIKANETLKGHIATFGAFRDLLREKRHGTAENDLMLASITAAYVPGEGQDDKRS